MLIALFFVYRSFYGMRIGVDVTRASMAKAAATTAAATH